MVFSLAALALRAVEVAQPTLMVARPEDNSRAEVTFSADADQDSYGMTEVVQDESDEPEFHYAMPEFIEEWNSKLERRYNELVVECATGKETREKMNELNRLQHERRNLLNPRPPEEIMAEARMTKVTAALIAAYDNYVQHQQQASPWKGAKADFYKPPQG